MTLTFVAVGAVALLAIAVARILTRPSRKVLMEMLARNAFVLDVRTPAEYAQGHVPGSLNLPLDQLQANLAKVPRDRAVLACCASGARSGMAVAILRQAGYTDVTNAGPWTSLRS